MPTSDKCSEKDNGEVMWNARAGQKWTMVIKLLPHKLRHIGREWTSHDTVKK